MKCGTRFWGDPYEAGFAVWRGRFFGAGEIRLALLSLVAEGPSHGYELMKKLEERAGGDYRASAGTVYPTLQQLEDEGFIASEFEHYAPVVPAPRPAPDVPDLLVEPLQLSASSVGRAIHAFAFLRVLRDVLTRAGAHHFLAPAESNGGVWRKPRPLARREAARMRWICP